MSRKDLSKILAKGTARKRVLLLANHIAQTAFVEDGFLSENEFSALMNSIKTDGDIRIYNLIRKAEQDLRFFLLYLNQIKLGYFDVVSQIIGYFLLRKSYKKTEDMANTLLGFVKDKKDAVNEIKKCDFLLAVTDEDEEGFVIIDTSKKGGKNNNSESYNLDDLMEILKHRAKELLIRLKTGIKLARDYMGENGAAIKAYKKRLKEIENAVKEGIFILPLYRANMADGMDKTGIYRKYKVLEDYDNIKIDQELYEHFKAQSFSNE